MRVLISQRMRGLSAAEIAETRRKAAEKLEREGHTVIDSPIDGWDDDWYLHREFTKSGVNTGVMLMAKTLEAMATADAVFFCKGWESARGCAVEETVANAYGIECIYEK